MEWMEVWQTMKGWMETVYQNDGLLGVGVLALIALALFHFLRDDIVAFIDKRMGNSDGD